MKKLALDTWLFFLSLILLGIYIMWTFHIAWQWVYHLLIPFILGIPALVAIIIKYTILKKWSFYSIYIILTTATLLTVDTLIYIDQYKPTSIIKIPENYLGLVQLYPSKEITKEVIVNDKGIGYWNPGEVQVNWKIIHNGRNISDALNNSNTTRLDFYSADSLVLDMIEVTCFTVKKDNHYSGKYGPWTCDCRIEKEDYLGLLDQDLVDSNRILIQHYDNSKKVPGN